MKVILGNAHIYIYIYIQVGNHEGKRQKVGPGGGLPYIYI